MSIRRAPAAVHALRGTPALLSCPRDEPDRSAGATRAARRLSDAFDPHANGFTALRLGLALLVVFSHSFVAGGWGFDPLYEVTGGQMQLGSVGVLGFFALSGFLLARSHENTGRVAFARNRALRILPGLWVCAAIMIVGVVPLALMMGGTATIQEVAEIGARAVILNFDPLHVRGLFPGSGRPDMVNAPLWTLPVEVGAYAVLWAMPRQFMQVGAFVIVAFVAIVSARIAGASLYLHMPIAFFLGVIAYRHRSDLPASWLAAGLLLGATAASAVAGGLAVVAPLTLPYVMILAGLRIPFRWTTDVSFGTYIYGWPVQQLLAVAGLPALGLGAYLAATMALVLPIAFVSWRAFERPAMRLRSGPRLIARASADEGRSSA